MTDRELLELAAKAAGVDHCGWWTTMNALALANHAGAAWNPLTDDGDALRLAVQCRIDVWFLGLGCVKARADGGLIETVVVHEGDSQHAATRRAITRAAAAMASATEAG